MDIVTYAAAKKAARQFDAADAGKVAVVGADGVIVPETVAAGEVVIDDTLAIEGAAADSAAAGEAIAALETDIGDLDALETTAKTDLVSAINEAAKSGSTVEVVRLDE